MSVHSVFAFEHGTIHMNHAHLERFHAEAQAGNVLLHYSGEFTPPIVAALSDSVRERLDDTAPDRRIARRVFSAFIEMAQNVLHYAAGEAPAGAPQGTLTVVRDGAQFEVSCRNRIRNCDVARVRQRVERVRAMTLDEIKAAYRAQLRNDEHDEEDTVSKGAGLGFLTLAREASQPIDYVIEAVADTPDDADFQLRAII